MMKRLLLAAVMIGIIATAMKKAKMDRENWQGLSEHEARDRLEERLPNKIPDDRREYIKDTIVTKMRDRGVLTDDDIDMTAPEHAIDLADALDKAEETADA
jgi:hypothetical protein